MKYPRMRSGAVLLASAISSTHVLANGVAINEESASGAGVSYAGRAATARDASTLYGNPAGMSKLTRPEMSFGVNFLKARVDIKDVRTSADQGTNKGDMVPVMPLPSSFFVTPLNDRWHVGIGMYAPFGTISDYEKTFQGAGQGLFSAIKVVTLQPSVSYKFSDRFSVGGGITFNRMTATQTETLETHKFQHVLGGPFSDTHVNSHGDDDKWGYNLGVLWDMTDKTRVGMAYHSKLDFKTDGRTRINGFPNFNVKLGPIAVKAPLGDFANQEFSSKMNYNMPDSLDLSMVHKLTDRWTFYGGFTWTHWARFKVVNIDNEGMNPILGYYLNKIKEDFNFHNTWSTAVGTSYQLTPKWELRGGFSLDPSPYSNDDRGVRMPVGNRKNYTVGVGYTPNENWEFNGVLAYLRESPHLINKPARTDIGGELQPKYQARFNNSAWAVGFGVTQRF